MLEATGRVFLKSLGKSNILVFEPTSGDLTGLPEDASYVSRRPNS
jgi:hypothetical protein